MSSTLFPETTSPPSSEPPVWVRRLVILDSIDPEPIEIRNIPFDLGLNIICTKPPTPDSTEAMGHDVGKTLLTRLLRYTLGEPSFAEGRTRTAIRRAFPDSWVAAELRVSGESWSVMRPLGAAMAHHSRAAAVDSWRDLLTLPADANSYPTFLTAVSEAVLESIESPMLTHKGRPVNWMDVLAWVARDQKCRYAHPLIWRHRDADSDNDPLNVEDASTALRCVSGLMSGKESELFEAHDALLKERRQRERERDSLRAAFDAEDGIIEQDLRQFLDADDILPNELAPEIIRNRAQGLRDLRDEERDKRDIGNLRDAFEMALQARAELAAEERQLNGHITAVRQQLERRQVQKPSQSIYDAFLRLCDRATDDCPAKLKIATQELPDPYREEEIARLQSELLEATSRRTEVQGLVVDRDQAVTTTKRNLEAVQEELATIIGDISGRLALHDAMLRRVERHVSRVSGSNAAINRITKLDELIQNSSEEQRELRDSLAESREWLSSRFKTICHELLGGNREFEIAIEAKAVRLNVAGANAAPGEATSTSALVLSLDLAALQSAIDGFGHHPRFALLDSPREADMEIGIFQRLVALLTSWHLSDRRGAFQIIMTTTTRPNLELIPQQIIRTELARKPETDLLFGREL